jgi:hypothetical protein
VKKTKTLAGQRYFEYNNALLKTVDVILSAAKNLTVFEQKKRFFTSLRFVQNDGGISFQQSNTII